MPRQRQGEAPWAPRPSLESERDALLAHFGPSQFAQDTLAKLQEEGYAILPKIFSEDEVQVELDRMWGFVETVSPGVSRARPESWRRHGGVDPWPHAQRDMFQLHQAGWLFSDLRESMAARVFEPLYGTRELHVSKDGFTFFRPTHRQVLTTPNDHYDQGLAALGLHCVQGSVTLTDQEDDDGCFLVWPRSHSVREAVLGAMKGSSAQRDFLMLSEDEKDVLRSFGLEAVRVPVKKGDVILWRSDVCHCGAPPIGARPGFRAVAYICCLPAELSPEAVYADKRRAYDRLETGCHWPSREEWFEPRAKHGQIVTRPYFKSLPTLTYRQQELYGLVRYDRGDAVAAAPTSRPRALRWRKRDGGSEAEGGKAAPA